MGFLGTTSDTLKYENGVKTIQSLKDELGLVNVHFLSHSRLVRQILHFITRNLGLETNGVVTPADKHGRTSLDYVPFIIKAFKQIKK